MGGGGDAAGSQADQEPAPTLLLARTRNSYLLPAVSPVKLWLRAAALSRLFESIVELRYRRRWTS